MIAVMIIPTGIGCAIGGHSGDATPAAKLLASCCDKLIVHPNIVNASDINEMTENMLYVEGSMLDRFLWDEIELKEVSRNKILLVVNSPLPNEIENAVSAARATIGAEIEILVLKENLELIATMEGGCARGKVKGWEELVKQVKNYKFDALAVNTPITISRETLYSYFKQGGVNPIGGVEAIASKLISTALNKPVAHAPFEDDEEWNKFNDIVFPEVAAEMMSLTNLHSVLKGLHKAPRIGKGLSVEDIDVMVSPYGCWGRPHYACVEADIPIVMVKENKCVLNQTPPDDVVIVENYWEAAGILMCMQAGVTPESVRRPLIKTMVKQT